MAAYAERDEIDGDHKRYKSTMTEKRNTTTIIHNIDNREDW